MSVVLSVDRLDVYYGNHHVLQDVSFQVQKGECVVLLGSNGAGKSTLLQSLMGEFSTARRAVRIDGKSLSECSAREVAQLISFVPQEEVSAYAFSAREIVAMGRFAMAGTLFDTPEDRAAVDQALDRTDCLDLADRSIQQVSGGEKQRILVARALAQATPIMLLDEPTSHMDVRHTLEMERLIESLKRDEQTLLIAVHDLNFAFRVADRLLLLDAGKLTFDGNLDQLLNSRALENAYKTTFEVLSREDGSRWIAPLSTKM